MGDFNVCTVLMPEFAWPYVNRGLALARAGRLAEAIDSFDRAMALRPELRRALWPAAGWRCLEAGEAERAGRDLARAFELGRRDAAVRAGQAEALAKLGRLDQALAIYGELLASRPYRRPPARRAGHGPARDGPEGGRGRLPRRPRQRRGLGRRPLRPRPHPLPLRPEVGPRPRRPRPRAGPSFLDALQLRALIRAHLGRPDAVDDVDRLVQTPTPHRLYNAACALADPRRPTDPATSPAPSASSAARSSPASPRPRPATTPIWHRSPLVPSSAPSCNR